MYSTASRCCFLGRLAAWTTTLFTNVCRDPPTCVQMRRVGSGAAAPSVWQDKRTSNFGSAAAAWIGTPWTGGVWAPVFTVSLREGGVWLILWARVHVCAPGMCTVLELTDKGWRGEERRGLGIKRKRRCASLWVEARVWMPDWRTVAKSWHHSSKKVKYGACANVLSLSTQFLFVTLCVKTLGLFLLTRQPAQHVQTPKTHPSSTLFALQKNKKEKKTVTKLVSVNMWSQQLSWTLTSPQNAAEFFKVTI